MREHIVVAMVGQNPAKVECTSCHRQHQYRAAPPGTKKEKEPRAPRTAGGRPRREGTAAATPAVAPVDLEARIANRTPQRYDAAHRFAIDDVVEHPSFGLGVVIGLPGAQKIEVLFSSGAKLLLHDRGGAKMGLQRPPPRSEENGPHVSDAPPPKR
jgi:hypothetical protein